MAARSRANERDVTRANGITKISVRGYKSIAEECSMEIRPLTILSGANSSGKSSVLQPLLLLKQTLETDYDPGSLLINGPNVQFTSAESQLLSKLSSDRRSEDFCVELEISGDQRLTQVFGGGTNKGVELAAMTYENDEEKYTLWPSMSPKEVESVVPASLREFEEFFVDSFAEEEQGEVPDLEFAALLFLAGLEIDQEPDPGHVAVGHPGAVDDQAGGVIRPDQRGPLLPDRPGSAGRQVAPEAEDHGRPVFLDFQGGRPYCSVTVQSYNPGQVSGSSLLRS